MLSSTLKISLIFIATLVAVAAEENPPPLYRTVVDKLYHFSEEQLNWSDAEQKCREMNGSLAAYEEWMDLEKMSMFLIYHFPMAASLLRYWWVADGFPEAENNLCMHLEFEQLATSTPGLSNIHYKMKYLDCNQESNYICESDFPISPTSQQKRVGFYQRVGGRLLHFSEEKLNRFEAQSKCAELGGFLADFPTRYDEQTVFNYMLYYFPHQSFLDREWIVGNIFPVLGNFDPEVCKNFVYNTRTDNYQIKWSEPSIPAHYICKRKLNFMQLYPRRNAELYKPVGDRWYHFSDDQLNWPEAYNKCLTIGGYLGSLDRRGDQTIVSQYLVNNLPSDKYWWTSGTNNFWTMNFTWYDKNTPAYFIDWADTPFDDYDRKSHCLNLLYSEAKNKYVMKGLDCNQKANYICEWYDNNI